MRKAGIAEWVLSLVTTRERASVIVGDLLEDRTEPFWDGLTGTAVSMLWREMRYRPVWALVRSAVLWAAYCLASVTLTVVASVVWGVLAGHTGLELIANRIPPPGGWLGPSVWYAVMPYVMGRCAALLSADRELAAAAVTGIVWPLLALTSDVPAEGFPWVQVFLLLGAAQVRASRGNSWQEGNV